MSIKEKLTEVLKKLVAKVEDKELLSEVEDSFRLIEREEANLISDKRIAESEAIDRKNKLKDLKSEKEDWDHEKQKMETQITELQTKVEDPTHKKEIEALQSKVAKFQKIQTESFLKSFEKISQHEKWDKVKPLFHIPEEKNEDESLKWDTITPEKMEINISKLQELNEIEYFGEVKIPDISTPKGTPFPNKKEESPKNIQEAEGAFDSYRKEKGLA